jgi:hypothetical protein
MFRRNSTEDPRGERCGASAVAGADHTLRASEGRSRCPAAAEARYRLQGFDGSDMQSRIERETILRCKGVAPRSIGSEEQKVPRALGYD